MKLNYMALVQARLTSNRFPGKVLEPINDKKLIEHVDYYCKNNFGTNYAFLIPDSTSNDDLYNFLQTKKRLVFRDSEHNVLKRYQNAIKKFEPDFFIRITADNPIKCTDIIKEMIKNFINSNLKVLTNSVIQTFPKGLEVEIIDSDYFLEKTKSFKKKEYLEHVSLGIYKEHYKDVKHFLSTTKNNDIRLTIDYKNDISLPESIFKILNDEEMNYKNILNIVNKITGSKRDIGDYYIQ